MQQIIACIDRTPGSLVVCDYGAWLARRLSKPLLLLNVTDLQDSPDAGWNLGGSVAASAAANLIERMAELDEQRGQLAAEHGRLVLDQAATRAQAAGVTDIITDQRQGDLLQILAELEPVNRMLVMGRNYDQTPAGPISRLLDHSIERAVRTLSHPVMVTTGEFAEPRGFMIAFDASQTGQRIIDAVIASPVLRHLPAHLVTVGHHNDDYQKAVDQASTRLIENGRTVQIHRLDGEPESALTEFAQTADVDLLIMGAYGHGRIRELFVGSVTTAVLRTSPVPVVVLR